MHLWNDYEGKTIAEAYPLDKLLRPEGRSAFFVTTNGTGTANVIRLTESLNDEHEMLERWRQVSEVHQENLVAIKSFGQTTFDGVPLAYALMEPTDANLAEILAERPLTSAETTEVGISVVAALRALHETGLIHEHVEPANVLASGEVIKLRSDCVRECVGDPEFSTPATCEELKQRDIHDLGVLLLRCLTLEKQWAPGMKLAAPFHLIVPRAIDGSWGLQEIADALQPPAVAPVKPLVPEGVIPVRGVNQAGPQARLAQAKAVPLSTAHPAEPRVPAVQESIAFPGAAPGSVSSRIPSPGPSLTGPGPSLTGPGPSLKVRRIHTDEIERKPSIPRSWVLGGAAVLVVLLLLWWLVPSKSGTPKPQAAAASGAIKTIDDAPAGPAPAPSAPAKHVTLAAATPAASGTAASVQAGWRVVCYTFLHEDQAWSRAGALRRTHNSLQPGVFAPSAKGPYLVTLGGAMTESQADIVLKQARRSGLPRDTFIRFYPAR
jgi:hypothetical protein